MKRILVTAAWIGIASYCVLATIAGPSGIVATGKAAKATTSMQDNLASLKERNASYSAEWASLSALPESMALEARALGYLGDDEVAVRLASGARYAAPHDAGTRLLYEPEKTASDGLLKLTALVLAIAYALAAMVLGRVGRGSPYRESRDQEAVRT